MGEAKNIETECPVCSNHCPAEQLHCPRGEEYFGVKAKDGRGHHQGARQDISKLPTDEAVLALMRKCGHYLHHNVGHGTQADTKALLFALSEEEKKELIRLLEKCTKDWQL